MFDAVVKLPWLSLGVRTSGERVLGLEFLEEAKAAIDPEPGSLAAEVEHQLRSYFKNPGFAFDLPLNMAGTDHQRAVWRCMLAIPVGQTRSYGDIARELRSSPRAVGGACHANPLPLLVPCHRVVSASGIGGFSGDREGGWVNLKRRLLEHEGAVRSLF